MRKNNKAWSIIILMILFQLQLLQSYAQSSTVVKGKVVDARNLPLPRVNIKISGSTGGTETNQQGEYTLKVPASGKQILVFTFIGYEPQQVTVTPNKNEYNITLADKTSDLDQVVVVGYGTTKKRDLTGSVATLKGSAFNEKPLSSMQQAMRGQLAGVQVNTLSGAPGAGISIRVRGGTSVSAGMEPLYVINGIPVYNDQTYVASDPLSNINPSDIESIEVLKDASATAIYGSRGANGVVLVTTKRGKEGKAEVNLNAKYGVQNRAKKIDLLNSEEFFRLANQGYLYSKQFATIQNPVKDPALNYADVDWQDEVFQSAPQQSYELSVSGGNKTTTYLASLGRFDQQGIVIGSNVKRTSGRLSLETRINPNLSFGSNVLISSVGRNFVKDVLANAIAIVPYMPVYDAAGRYAFIRDYSNFGTTTTNPVALAREASNKTTSDRILGSAYLSFNFLNDFTFKVTGSADLNNQDNGAYTPSTIEPDRAVNGIATINTGRSVTLLQESILSYKKTLGTIHQIDALVGFSSQNNIVTGRSSSSQGFLTNAFDVNNIGSAEKINFIGSNKAKYTINSFISRANYSLLGRYLFTATFRADGSSRFGANNKVGYFPSGAFAWRISDEKFFKNNTTITNLKLRTSYGLTGNQEIGLYRSIQRIASSMVSLTDASTVVGYYTSSLGYPNLSWEKTKQFDAGLDLSLFDRVNLSFDYYDKRTSDVLFEVTAPPSTGFSSYLRNTGAIRNRGLELTVNSLVIDKPDFKWNMAFNISGNRNVVTDLGGSKEILVPVSGGVSLIRQGQPMGAFYGYIYDGTFKTAEEVNATPWAKEANQVPGHVKLRDIASINAQGNRVLVPDGYVTDADQTIIGNPNPKFIYGFSSNFKYKAFDLNFTAYGSYGNDIFNVIFREAQVFAGNKNGLRSALNSSVPASVSPDGVAHITDIPLATFTFTGRSKFTGGSYSNNIENGSFFRLSDITLGYTLPLKGTLYVKRARLYASVQNLFTITRYSGYDPDVSNQYGRDTQYPSVNMGYDADPYPVARAFNLGLSINF